MRYLIEVHARPLRRSCECVWLSRTAWRQPPLHWTVCDAEVIAALAGQVEARPSRGFWKYCKVLRRALPDWSHKRPMGQAQRNGDPATSSPASPTRTPTSNVSARRSWKSTGHPPRRRARGGVLVDARIQRRVPHDSLGELALAEYRKHVAGSSTF